jgi:Ca2+-binding EF-hand superfamily protein
MGSQIAIAAVLGVLSLAAAADDREDYNRRAAQRDMAAFQELDRNHDQRLTPDEVKGMLSLEARFNDIDINRDGAITLEEMKRYLDQTYGISVAAP